MKRVFKNYNVNVTGGSMAYGRVVFHYLKEERRVHFSGRIEKV